MFYNQPLAHRFGTALAADIGSEKWNHIEIAVAWVRRSGTQHLEESFRKFLGRGGFVHVTVGVDIENTSAEGLKDLLALQAHGNIETYVHHNEAETTFHPKVYLFRNDEDARLIVGSNNLTEAGFFVNTEAGLQLDAPLNDPLILDARTALAVWRDTSTGLARHLDATLLADLVRLGYVFPEQELRKRRKASGDQANAKRSATTQALFKAQRYAAPPVRRAPSWNRAHPSASRSIESASKTIGDAWVTTARTTTRERSKANRPPSGRVRSSSSNSSTVSPFSVVMKKWGSSFQTMLSQPRRVTVNSEDGAGYG